MAMSNMTRSKEMIGRLYYTTIRCVPVYVEVNSVSTTLPGGRSTACIQVVTAHHSGKGEMLGTEWGDVNVDKLEQIASDEFEVGEEVQSVLNGGYGSRFIVTGFEGKNNRVVCRPVRLDPHDRTRYAYKPKELTRAYYFARVGFTFKVNDCMEVIVAEHPESENLVQLVVMKGKFIGKIFVVPYNKQTGYILKSDLEDIGINVLQ